jgi:signal transduction histidine kinase
MRPQRGRHELADHGGLELAVLEESTIVAALLVSPDGKVLGSNARLRALLGVTDPRALVGRKLHELLVDAGDWASWQQALTAGRALALRLQSGGRVVSLRGDVRAVKGVVCGTFVEANADENLRAAVQQSARMEALGSLTAGIAHDFNNLLTVLVGNLYLLAEDLRGNPKLFERLKAARDAGKRGADLIKQLLTFARREQFTTGIVEPSKVISELTPLLRRALGSRITLETDLDAASVPIRASQAQLESVIVNLAINARDAIEGKGAVRLQVRRVGFSPDEAARRRLSRAGQFVALSVRDDGKGIPEDVLGRVFEPFFSTKGERGGTGLGLSMVRWFAEQGGGVVEIASAVGQGTTVTLLLPVTQDQVIDSHEMTMPLSTLQTGDERILVVAPDESLRATIRQILEVLGYSVTFTAGAADVPGAVRTNEAQLLMLDATMRDEADLIARARAVRPGLKVIVTVDGQSHVERVKALGATALLKPFSLADLAGSVRRTLDDR